MQHMLRQHINFSLHRLVAVNHCKDLREVTAFFGRLDTFQDRSLLHHTDDGEPGGCSYFLSVGFHSLAGFLFSIS